MTNDPISSPADSEEERVRRAEELLAQCTNPKANTDGWIPAWSSYMLDRIIEKILDVPGAETNDLLKGLWNLLDHTQAPLHPHMTEFQRAITIQTFYPRRRAQRVRADFGWMVNAINQGCTTAQAYLSIFIFNDEQLLACKKAIIAVLENSEFLHRVLHTGSMMSPDVLPYGHYQIEPIELESGIVDGVFYDYWVGAKVGNVISEVHNNHERIRVLPLNGYHPAPSHWQELIQKRLDNDDEV